jgi:hypothetical protein
MTTKLEEIFSLYRQADSTAQLAMYLQFRELRDDFREIDQEEADRKATTSAHDSLAFCKET